jgi:hypothetical protein
MMDPRLVVEIMLERARHRWKSVRMINWFPVPTAAQKTPGNSGNRKTSPWINFHPDCAQTQGEPYSGAKAWHKPIMLTHLFLFEGIIVKLHVPRKIILEDSQ